MTKGPDAETTVAKPKRKQSRPSSNSRQHIATLKNRMYQAMVKTLGIVTYAAQKAKIDRTTHYGWMKDDPEYAAKINAIQDMAIDFAEDSLKQQIRAKNTIATLFYLKCKGKQRGFIDKPEASGEADGEKIAAALMAIADGLKVR